MSSPSPPPQNLVALRDTRERVIARLSEAFTSDTIDMDEFDRRLGLAHRADDVATLEALITDLTPPSSSTALAPSPQPPHAALVPADAARAKQWVGAIMGGAERKGRWRPARKIRAIAIMGGIDLDFREAEFAPGVTELTLVVLMGGVDIVVPPWLSIEVEGTAIMGGMEHVDRTPTNPDPSAPLLRVRGLAVMGGVSVQTRLPGESNRDARRRAKREARALADARKKELGAPRD